MQNTNLQSKPFRFGCSIFKDFFLKRLTREGVIKTFPATMTIKIRLSGGDKILVGKKKIVDKNK